MAETTKTFLGKYELLEVIGDGAEGRVYKASCNADTVPGVARGELVALKRLKSTGHEKESQQFLRQIKILSKLKHPNIVGHKDSFVWREKELEEDIYCLVMELLDGEPLKQLIEKYRGGLPWELAGGILSQTLQALQYASKNGVIHRDLKPSNIFITKSGVPKLVDFGIARQDDGESTATSSAAGAKGTFDYMAPDFALQHGGFRGDEQSDIFSFGVILYYTLAGALPFPQLGEHADRGYYIRWLGQQMPIAEFRHPVFRVLAHARSCIGRCIDPDREARFKTFDEVMADFAQVGYRKLKHGSEVYEFTDWLGKGGFGEVFRARRVSDRRDVAVKRLFSTGQSSRFVREAKILRDAAHPNLTEYVDFVEVRVRDDEREYYLILEYLAGMPDAGLKDRIKNSENGLDPTEALQLFVCYLDCLEHLHKNGIIHRDIKPGNLYAPAGNPRKAKIFDLGIAHDEEGTRTHGQVPGTLDFMPPEFATQTSGRGSAQSDIYSIGVTLYQTLTKKLPFPRLPDKEAEAWIAFFRRGDKPLDCPFDHPVFTSRTELVPLLRRALAHDPKRRFESAGAMRDEIKKILLKWGATSFDYDDERPTAATMIMPQPASKRPAPEEEFEDIEVLEAAPVPAVDPAELERQRRADAEAEKNKRAEAERLAQEKERQAEAARIKAREEAERLAQEQARKAAADAEKRQREEAERLVREKERQAAEEAARVRTREEAERFAQEQARKAAEDAEKRKREEAEHLVREKERQAAEEIRRKEREAAEEAARIKAREEAERLAKERAIKAAEEAEKRKREEAERLVREKERQAAEEAARIKAREEAERLAKERAIKAAEEAEKRKREEAERLVREKERQAAEEIRRKEREAAERVEQERRRIAAAEAAEKKRIEDARLAKIRAEQAEQRRKTMAKVSKVAAIFVGIALLAIAGYFGWNKAKISMQENAYSKAASQAHADFQSGDFTGSITEAEKALAIHKDDSAMQKLIADAQAQIKIQQSYGGLMKDGQAAFDNHDYSNALVKASSALQQVPNDSAATKLQDGAQRFLTDYHNAVARANAAFKGNDFANANAEAEKALAVYPNDAAMKQIKSSAVAQIANQRAYTDAMKNAQAAYAGRDFTNAVAMAKEALRKFPNEPNATKLQDDAQKYLNSYHDAVNAANTAFGNNDFVTAETQADAALGIYPRDAAMLKLKADAQTEGKKRAKYTDAYKNARTFFDSHDYTNSLAWAMQALKELPGDANAGKLRDSAQTMLNNYHEAVNAANAAAQKGDYNGIVTAADKALAIYANDPAMQSLKSSAQARIATQQAYTDALNKAQAALDSHDYATAATWAATALQKVPNDAAATKIQESASKELNRFSDTITRAQTAFKNRDFAGAVTLADQALSIRKDDATAQKIKSDVLLELDIQLVTLLQEFNVSVPTELKYAVVKHVDRLGIIGDTGKPYYLGQADLLEKGYRAGGTWLSEGNRKPSLSDLRKAIDSWE
jgi:serine/threonine protein kinase